MGDKYCSGNLTQYLLKCRTLIRETINCRMDYIIGLYNLTTQHLKALTLYYNIILQDAPSLK